MKLTDLFLEELETEANASRKVLANVPSGRNHWKPHEKSMELGYLASLVATMPAWIELMVNRQELDIQSAVGAEFKPKEWTTGCDLVEILDASAAKARAALTATTEEHQMKPWRFLMGGKAISELPRYVMIRDSTFNHLAHHRGQLTVYLRLNEAIVPAIYGPSADEKF
jgi:uncharacterized damage-inducible protein DinB